jgi:hypothetical protein
MRFDFSAKSLYSAIMTTFFRFTLFEESKQIADQLGLMCDQNSRKDLFEWYLTFDNKQDAIAFGLFLFVGDRFLEHGYSTWTEDPRSN